MKNLLKLSIATILLSANFIPSASAELATKIEPANGNQPEVITIEYEGKDWQTAADRRQYYRGICGLYKMKKPVVDIMRIAQMVYIDGAQDRGMRVSYEQARSVALSRATQYLMVASEDPRCESSIY